MIRVRNIKVNIENDTNSILTTKISKILHVNHKDILDVKINKKSLDARKKDNLFYVYELDVLLKNEEHILKKHQSKDIFLTPNEEYIFPKEHANIEGSVVIVGSGPAGLFAGYLLATSGYNPIIIEQGENIEKRVESVDNFFKTGKLNINSNIQFGEGGAGTFSDGKLNTLVKDKEFRCKKVFEIFVEAGAPEEIMYINNPHIGTDLLRNVIINMRNKMISLGATFRYNTKLTNLIIKDNELEKIELNGSEIVPCKNLILAIGHSARDTFYMLHKNNVLMTSKAFAVGLRIEHPQEMININQYGKYHDKLPPASYKLTYQTKEGRGVYSFCMCPGGHVVNASSEDKHLAINGMSNHARDSKNANSALVVTITKDDFGTDTLAGIEFQRNLEKKAYEIASGKIPVQLLRDFVNNKKSSSLGDVEVITKGDYALSNLNDILPDYIANSIKEAIPDFATKIKGYDRKDAILLGIESRTSSPVRIVRDELGMSNTKGLYPAGEGAGYAGGITTSAMDGLKVAEHLIKNNL